MSTHEGHKPAELFVVVGSANFDPETDRLSITMEDMLADDPELTEDDFEGECIARDREQDAEDAAEECPWCGTVGCTGSPCDYSSSFDARSDEILERTRG